jgi:A/G-specific adenine glycosylase
MPRSASPDKRKDRPAEAEAAIAADDRQRFRRALLRWYRQSYRPLPWRAPPGERPEPYHVLVSEAMLQQTQVATVIPYFHRFIERFPTVEALADADQQQVLTLWQGLGYYRRARHLHAAARVIVQQHSGQVPGEVQTLRSLPGVGDYTAGAIASIAFGRPAPILDGNVARVLARWAGIDQPIDATATRKRLWQMAGELVQGKHPGDFNQALMELGALVCIKGEPRCLMCPLADTCYANQHGLTQSLPRVLPRRGKTAVTHHVVAIRKGDRYLFERRPDDGLWAGMWQLPTFESPEDASVSALSEACRHRFGLEVELEAEPISRFTHQTTHRSITFVVTPARVQTGRLKPHAGAWRRLDRVEDLPLANPQHRAIAALQ